LVGVLRDSGQGIIHLPVRGVQLRPAENGLPKEGETVWDAPEGLLRAGERVEFRGDADSNLVVEHLRRAVGIVPEINVSSSGSGRLDIVLHMGLDPTAELVQCLIKLGRELTDAAEK
jgi:hypothetical protein